MKIEILGKFYDQHSLSIVNRNLAFELSKKIKVQITPLDSYTPEAKLSEQELDRLEELKAIELQSEPDIQIRHSYPPIWRWPLSDKTKVVFIQPWEFSKVPFEWQYKWEQFADAIICPSKWNAERYLEGGVNPIKLYAIPNGYDPKIYNKNRNKNDKLTFTFVGCGQFRKGVDILLNAWVKSSITKADKVRLIIKDNPSVYGNNNLLHEIIKAQYSTNCAEIIYNDDLYNQEEMASLYKETDVLVHPFRGEGFGMHIQEAMACGALPLITRGGAPGQFTSEEDSLYIEAHNNLVDATNPELMAGKPGDSFTGMGQHMFMLEPIMEDLAKKISAIYFSHTRDEILSKVNNSKLLSTWETVGDKYIQALTEINKRKVHRI